MRILVVEDDAPLSSFVRKGLEAEHYAVDVAHDGEQARLLAHEVAYDLVILDLNLPKLDGLSLLAELRPRKPSLPVLVLTARSRVEDRVKSLDCGADDCLIKPFSFAELSARVRALLRRGRPVADSVLKVADLQLDRIERRVQRGGRGIELTSKEFALLEYLMRNVGRRITRAMIIEHVWNLSFDTTTNVVDVYINYASSQVDKAKMGKLAAAIEGAFQDLGASPRSSIGPPMQIMEQPTGGSGGNHEGAPGAYIKNAGPNSLSSSIPQQRSGMERQDSAKLRRELENLLAHEIERHEVALRVGPEGLVISLREIGFFDSGSAVLKAGSEMAVGRIAGLLRDRDVFVRVEGHTDNLPIRTAQFTSNWELSTARATEVIRVLISRHRFRPQRLSAAGYGEFHPIATNTSASNRQLNRRVDLVVLARREDAIGAAGQVDSRPDGRAR